MSNAVFKLVVQTLAQAVSDRAADRMVRAALEDLHLHPDDVSAQEMQRVLVGPLLTRLAAVMPRSRAQQELVSLAGGLQEHYPKAPTLFDAPGDPAGPPVWPPTWQGDLPALVSPAPAARALSVLSAAGDNFFARLPAPSGPPAQPSVVLMADPAADLGRPGARAAAPSTEASPAAISPAPRAGETMPDEHNPSEALSRAEFGSDDFDWDPDDFEFDDPEEGLRVEVAPRSYRLSLPADQEALLGDLARQRGVQGVVLCGPQGQVVRARLTRGAQPLSSVIAATALVFQDRPWRVMCADLGDQTVCMRALGGHYVALLASGQANIGRLIAELGALREAL